MFENYRSDVLSYDGANASSPRIAMIDLAYDGPSSFSSSGGPLTLVFVKSVDFPSLASFDASFSVFDCPFNCSGVGSCRNGQCVCPPSRVGAVCQHDVCGDDGTCSGHGDCTATGCDCDAGFSGSDCSMSVCAGVSNVVMAKGELGDHAGERNYGPNVRCAWFLPAVEGTGAVRTSLHFTRLETEAGYDFVNVYSRSQVNSTTDMRGGIVILALGTPVKSLSGNSNGLSFALEEDEVVIVFTTDEVISLS
jgi:hypothetical protein